MTDGVANTKLITVVEAALILDRSTTTVWRAIKEGKLTKHEVLGRTLVDRDEVDALKRDLSR